MAIAVVPRRRSPGRRGFATPVEHSTMLGALMFALLAMGLGVVAHVGVALAAPSGRAARMVERTPDVGVPTGQVDVDPLLSTGAPEPPSGPDADPNGAALVAGGQARVANTDRLGVIIHDAPRPGARTPRGFLQDARVGVMELSGAEWARVCGDHGLEGWVPTAYLIPAD